MKRFETSRETFLRRPKETSRETSLRRPKGRLMEQQLHSAHATMRTTIQIEIRNGLHNYTQ